MMHDLINISSTIILLQIYTRASSNLKEEILVFSAMKKDAVDSLET